MRTKWLIMMGIACVCAMPALARQKKSAQGFVPTNTVVSPPEGPTYIIHAADVLDISVWQQPNLSFKGLPVRPDGKISLPLINDVQAAGLTTMQLGDVITKRLTKFVRDPVVTVVVTQVNSQRYYVLGDVAKAGTYPLLPGLTALQALSASGGFTQFANPKKIYILRTMNGKQYKLPFNYKNVIAGRDLSQNIFLKPGDTIIVP
jgi:polysaccharide biosynthesis/export protein